MVTDLILILSRSLPFFLTNVSVSLAGALTTFAVLLSSSPQTVDCQMPFFESEMLLMYHVIASALLFIVDIDTLYGIGGEGVLHVLASGASVLTADQQRQKQFDIARELRIILPGIPAVMPVAIQTPVQSRIQSPIQSPAPTPPSTPRD